MQFSAVSHLTESSNSLTSNVPSVTYASNKSNKIAILAYAILFMSFAEMFSQNPKTPKCILLLGMALSIAYIAKIINSNKQSIECEYELIKDFTKEGFDFIDSDIRLNDPLNKVEQLALKTWTSQFYKQMNAVADGEQCDDQIDRINQIVVIALKKLPLERNQKGLKRKAHFNSSQIQELFQKGKIFKTNRFLSASHSNVDITGNVEFIINGQTGVNISSYSIHSRENEVLFAPKTKFRVEYVHQDSPFWTIEMTEIKSYLSCS